MRKVYLLFLIVLFSVTLLYAQAPYRSEQTANTTTAANQKYPDIAIDPDGNFTIVWESFGHPGDESGFAVVAQQFDSNGDMIGNERRINQTIVNDQYRPAIARDGLGNYYITWMSESQNSALSWEIKYRKYNSSFSSVIGETQVNVLDSLEQSEPDVAANASGQYVIVWDHMEADSSNNIHARLYRADDTTVDTTIIVNTTAAEDQRYPAVAMDDDGNFMVVWQSLYQDGSSHGIYGQFFDNTGAKIGSEFRINDENLGDQIRAKVATNANGLYAVTWASGEQDGSHLGIYGKMFNSDRSERFSEILINQTTLDSQTDPDIDLDDSNNFVITWMSYAQDTTATRDIFARRFDVDGNALSDEFQVNSYTPEDQVYPTVALRDGGEFVVTWNSWIDLTNRDDIRFQMYRMGPAFSRPTQISFDEDTNHEYNKSYYYPFVSDDNNTDAELTWGVISSGNLTAQLNGDLITITPTGNYFGTDSFRVLATDPTGLSDTTYQVVVVNSVDDNPTVANPIDDVQAAEDDPNTEIDMSTVFTDIDNDPLAISKAVFSNTDTTLVTTSISGNTLTLDYQPNQTGTATITIRATSNGLTVDDQFVVNVTGEDDPPTVANPIDDVEVDEDAVDTVIGLSGVFTDIDNNDNLIVESVFNNSNSTLVNASITGNTLTLAYQQDQFGSATITIRGTSNGKTVDDEFDVTVNPIDDGPTVANAIDDVEVDEDAANTEISLSNVFTDVDNDDAAITKSVQTNTNTGLVTASIASGVLTLDYQPGQSGSADITVRGTSNGKTVDDLFTVTVNPIDDAPTVAIPISDVEADEDAANTDIDLSAVFTDVDNDPAAITKAVFDNSNSTLVSASITNNTLTLAYQADQFGSATITIRGTSNGLTVDDQFDVTVYPIDDGPTVAAAIADFSVDEDAANTDIDLAPVFTDIDNSDAAITKAVLSNTNESLVVASIASGTLTLDYQLDQSGSADITIRATSNGKTVDDVFTVTVNIIDDAPTVANPIDDIIVIEDAANTVIDVTNVFDDVDNANASITKAVQANSNPGLVVASIVGNTLTLDYQPNMSGEATITIRGTSNGLTVDDQFLVTVGGINDPPTVANPIADFEVEEDAVNTVIDLTNVFDDVDNDNNLIVKTLQGNSTPTLVLANISGNNTLTLEYQANQSGEATIAIRATSGGQFIDDTFVVTVNAVDDAPLVANPITDVTVQEDAENSLIDLTTVFIDLDNDPLLIVKSVQSNDNQTLVTANVTGNILTLAYLADQTGEANIVIRATSNGLTVDDSFLVTVNPTDDAPTVANPIDDVTVDEDAVNTRIALAAVFTDLDNDDAAITKSILSNTDELLIGATISQDSLILDYKPNRHGSATIIVRGTSNGLSVTDEFQVIVNPVDDPPTVGNPIADVIVQEDAENTVIDLSNVFDDIDSNIFSIIKSVLSNSNPTLLTASISGDNLTLDYLANQTGSATIVIRGSSNGLTVNDTLLVTVTASDDAPTVANPIANVIVSEDAADTKIALAAVFTDVDNDDGAISKEVLSNSNEELLIATISQDTLFLNYQENKNGVATLTVRATSNGKSVNDVFEVNVAAVNDAPVITGQIAIITSEETPITIMLSQIEVSDVDNSYPTGFNLIVMDGANYTREINTITPVANFFGDLTVPVQVNDGKDASEIVDLTVTVNAVNDAPVITAPAMISFNEDDSLMYVVSDFYQWVSDVETADSLLLYSVKSGNKVWAIVDAPNVTIKAPNNWHGVDSVRVIVSDGFLADTADIQIVVNSVNDAPIIISVPDTVEFINSGNLVISMLEWVDDADLPEDVLEWDFSVSDEGLVYDFNDETFMLTLTAPRFWGNATLHFTVTDSSNASVMGSVAVKITADPTSIEYLNSQVPMTYELNQNYPNPFNPVTNIKFGLPKAGRVTIIIFNILGQKVTTLLDEVRPAGYHTLSFDAGHLASGIYFYTIQTQDFAQVKKMVLLK